MSAFSSLAWRFETISSAMTLKECTLLDADVVDVLLEAIGASTNKKKDNGNMDDEEEESDNDDNADATLDMNLTRCVSLILCNHMDALQTEQKPSVVTPVARQRAAVRIIRGER
jgi:hypothetical protein